MLELNMNGFVSMTVKRLPAAQEFVELYRLEMKFKKAVMQMYEAAPRKVEFYMSVTFFFLHRFESDGE